MSVEQTNSALSTLGFLAFGGTWMLLILCMFKYLSGGK